MSHGAALTSDEPHLSKMTVGRLLILRYRNGYRQGEKFWCANMRLIRKSNKR